MTHIFFWDSCFWASYIILCWVYICVDWFAFTNICWAWTASCIGDDVFFGGNAQTLDWFFYEDCSLLYWRLPIDKWGRIGVTALSVETVYWWLRWRESGDYFEGCILLEGCLGRIIKSSGFILLIDIKIEDKLIYADWYICVILLGNFYMLLVF